MKATKICLVVGLTAVLASSASAISLDWSTVDLNYVEFKLVSWDMTVIYGPTASAAGVTDVNNLTQGTYARANGGYYDTFGNRSDSAAYQEAYREDGWGIFRVTEIIDTRTGEPLWQGGPGSGEEIYAIYYGKVDNAVLGNNVNGYSVQSSGMRIDFYENVAGTFAAAGGALLGADGRTGFDEYKGITDGTLLWSTTTLNSGLAPLLGTSETDNQFQSQFNTSGTGANTGDYHGRLRITGGDAVWYDTFYTGNPIGDLEMGGHMYLNDGTFGSKVGNWTTRSQDPIKPITVGTPVIPEPLTMLGVGIGLVSLGTYIRRRMAA